MGGYELRLLGGPGLRRAGRDLAVRSRKTWFLLAYLALEGAAGRERLAELLWASPSGLANLRAELYRLERAAPGLVLRAGRRLDLGPAEVDARRFLELAERDDDEGALRLWRGPLLEGLEDGLPPELEEWLGHHRARYRELWTELLARRARREPDPKAAARLLRTLLEEDPLNEEAVRQLMRLHADAGTALEALRVYRRFADFLERELGLPPEAETRALARAIREGRARPPRTPDRRFAGRERELAAMRRAFDSGRSVFLCGEPGIGKTRLLNEFAASLGRRTLFLKAYPGDRAVPYATLARGVRELLAQGADPPERVVRELARVVPELGEPPPEASPARFVAAVAELVRPFLEQGWVLGVDDLQYLDSASAKLLFHLVEDLAPGPYLAAYRRGGLPRAVAAWVREALAAGRAVEVTPEPLDARAAAAVLGIELERARSLNRRAGGNPFFLLQLAGGGEEGAERVHALIQGRLQGAPALARRLAELAALAGDAYRLDLATDLLGTTPLEAAEASDELERLGLFRKGRASHDLIVEAIEAGLAPETKRLWHARLARALAGRVAPARLAEHHLAAGEAGAAAMRWVEAAREAERAYAYREALALFERALAAAPEDDRPRLAAESFVPRYRLYLALTDWEGAERLLAEAESFADAAGLPWLSARARLGRADLAFRRGRFDEAVSRAASLLRAGTLDPDGQAHAHYIQAVALQALGRHRETRACCRRALAAAPEDWTMRAWVKNTLAIAELNLGELELARAENREALERFRAQGDPVGEANAIRVMAELAAREGRPEEAERLFEEALALARRTGHQIVLGFVLAAATRFYESRGDRARVRALAAEGAELVGFYQAYFRARR